jgi:hypothetical protein
MKAMPEWTDSRLDEFARHTDWRFDKVDEQFDSMRREMNERFDKVDKRFEKVDDRFDSMQRDMNLRFDSIQHSMFHAAVVLATAFLTGSAAIVATQL